VHTRSVESAKARAHSKQVLPHYLEGNGNKQKKIERERLPNCWGELCDFSFDPRLETEGPEAKKKKGEVRRGKGGGQEAQLKQMSGGVGGGGGGGGGEGLSGPPPV